MAPLPTIRTTSDLYPPKPSDGVKRLTESLVAFRPDERGAAPELKRALTLPEREAMAARKAVLDKWMRPGLPTPMKLAIGEMFNGFGGAERSEDDQDLLNANYAYACRDRTLWAIERACLRFRSGTVKPDEVGEKVLSSTWRPSSAQLNRLAAKIEEQTSAEHFEVGEILRATVFLGPSDGAKARTEAEIGAVADHMSMRRAERDLEQVERQLRQEAEAEQTRRVAFAHADDTYRRAGLDPPRWLPGQVPTTLQMKLKFGWTIEEIDGRRVLVSPAKVRGGAEVG
jgi:hypothetical protein